MALIYVGFAYFALLALLIRYYQAIHRWDDEWDSLAKEERREIAQVQAAYDEILHPLPDLPRVFRTQGKATILINGVSAWEEEQDFSAIWQKPFLEESASGIRMKHFIAYSLN